jgi:hypothetical protein
MNPPALERGVIAALLQTGLESLSKNRETETA